MSFSLSKRGGAKKIKRGEGEGKGKVLERGVKEVGERRGRTRSMGERRERRERKEGQAWGNGRKGAGERI